MNRLILPPQRNLPETDRRAIHASLLRTSRAAPRPSKTGRPCRGTAGLLPAATRT